MAKTSPPVVHRSEKANLLGKAAKQDSPAAQNNLSLNNVRNPPDQAAPDRNRSQGAKSAETRLQPSRTFADNVNIVAVF
jgi:hypothetical protein